MCEGQVSRAVHAGFVVEQGRSLVVDLRESGVR